MLLMASGVSTSQTTDADLLQALSLCHYLDTHREQLSLMDKAVLEIGAGTGLVSVVATLLGKRTHCVFLASLMKNNSKKSLHVTIADWQVQKGKGDISHLMSLFLLPNFSYFTCSIKIF